MLLNNEDFSLFYIKRHKIVKNFSIKACNLTVFRQNTQTK